MVKLNVVHIATLIVLAGALVAGQASQRVVDLSGFPLERLPKQLGPWECTWEKRLTGKETEESRCVRREYENAEGVRVAVTMHLTSSRLGALRNWPVARMGTGWNVEELGVWRSGTVSGLPFEMTASEYWLLYRRAKHFSLIWFVSPRQQAASFERAQALGWRDKLLGACMWGELFVESLEAESENQVREATRDFAVRLAPHFRRLISTSTAARPAAPNVSRSTEKTE